MKTPKEKLQGLNKILIINDNAEKAYLDGFNASMNLDLKKLFRARAFQCSEFCSDLVIEIRHLGGNITYSSDLDLRFETPDFKRIIRAGNYKLMLSEINRLNSVCLDYYERVLKDFKFDKTLQNLLVSHKQIIGNTIKLNRYMNEFLNVNEGSIAMRANQNQVV